MSKKKKRGYWDEIGLAFMADAVADNSRLGTLGQRHTRRIAGEHARRALQIRQAKTRAILFLIGVAGVIIYVVTQLT